MIRGQQLSLGEIDGVSILANVVSVINSTRKPLEIALLDSFESAHADLGGFRDRFERNAPFEPPRRHTEDAFISHGLSVTVYHQNICLWV